MFPGVCLFKGAKRVGNITCILFKLVHFSTSGPTPTLLTSCGGHRSRCASYLNAFLFLPAATKLGQSNIFTHVCDSVNRGGGGSGPGGGPPIFQGGLQFFFFFFQIFFFFFFKSFFPKISSGMHQLPPPPPIQDGQCAAGTHPTGMHSCISFINE